MAESLDLISRLPDEILHKIISKVSFSEAIRTSTLSTSWMRLMSPSSAIARDESREELRRIFELFLTKSSRDVFQILKLYRRGSCDQLFIVAARGAHGELSLDFSGNKPWLPAPCNNFNLILDQKSCPNFSSSIKILHLRSVPRLAGDLLNDLFSSFRVLESLKLEKCQGLENLEIESNGCLEKFEMSDCPDVVGVVVSAEKLKSFSYRGVFAIIQLFESPNLADVTLNFRDGLDNNKAFDCEDALSLLCSVKDVENLTVNSWLIEALCSAGVIFDKLDFQFSKLKMVRCICSKLLSSKTRDSLACFLNATPSLEELLVKVDHTYDPVECPFINQYWHEPHLWRDYATVKSDACWLKDLKAVKIVGLTRENDQLLLMDLLLHKAINLKEMIVASQEGDCDDSWIVSRVPYSHLRYINKKYELISCPDIDSFFMLAEAKNCGLKNPKM